MRLVQQAEAVQIVCSDCMTDVPEANIENFHYRNPSADPHFTCLFNASDRESGV